MLSSGHEETEKARLIRTGKMTPFENLKKKEQKSSEILNKLDEEEKSIRKVNEQAYR